MSARPKIAVIGAGWAGLSAALTLYRQADVTVFEASRQAGGRARGLGASSKHGHLRDLDNGQHLLIGAYDSILRILAQVGVAEADAFVRQPLTWVMHAGMHMKCPKLPAPLHLIVGILRAKGLSKGDKIALLKGAKRLQALAALAPRQDVSVAEWLRQQGTSQHVIHQFWQPLVWATLNTPLAEASVKTLAAVVQEGVMSTRAHSDFLIPRISLHDLFVAPVLKYLAKHQVIISLGQRIQTLEAKGPGQVWVDGERFDQVLVCTAPYHARSLLANLGALDFEQYVDGLSYGSIATVYLHYDRPVVLPEYMIGLADGTAQWLVQRGALDFNQHEVAAVISCAQQYEGWDKQTWIDKIHADVLQVCPDLSAPLEAQVIIEKRGTILASVGREPQAHWQMNELGVYVAGDYLHPIYPATLEGAVESAQRVAAQCLLDWSESDSKTITR